MPSRPPLPPHPVNTLMYATGGFILSFVATGILNTGKFFPGNSAHWMENIYLILCVAPMAVLSLIFGIKAVNNESQRKQFQNTVWDYTRATGDAHYMPYILPVHDKLVITLFVTSLMLPALGHILSYYIMVAK